MMENIGKITLFIIGIIFCTIVNGLGLSILWAWFIVSTFGLVAITIPQAVGLGIVVAIMTFQITKREDKSAMDAILEITGNCIMKNVIFLSVGWVVTFFI